ncbi:hypothetical protein LX16_4906 [Stackebrandtia albiflava]|uniref:Uncharacterized protein n=1 Tax=Stackebrandtia albiflava TaxID=406432 RepID=A0A562UQ43_9ACTN|nr:hypothetical protein [Stackebrandtia albiflava]TWJ07745.1 hypothetical protein LX16_4906 [Stackebrandtia albiflava]
MTVNVSPDGPGTDSRSAGSREDVGMRYVRIAPIVEDGWFKGYFMDAEGYLAALPGFAAALPPGAREYAEDPAHYYFFGDRCVRGCLWSSFVASGGPVECIRKAEEVLRTGVVRRILRQRREAPTGRRAVEQQDRRQPLRT